MTHTVTTLPCGCVERRWLFGHDFLSLCIYHRWNPRPKHHGDWRANPERTVICRDPYCICPGLEKST